MAIAVNALQMGDEFLNIIDVVVKVEGTIGQRYGAGIFPVGDVDLVVLEHGLDGVAQQSGVMAGQWRHNQHGGLTLEFCQGGWVVGETLEAAQLAKGLVQLNPFVHRYTGAVHINSGQAKHRLFIVLAEAVNQAVASRCALHQRILAER